MIFLHHALFHSLHALITIARIQVQHIYSTTKGAVGGGGGGGNTFSRFYCIGILLMIPATKLMIPTLCWITHQPVVNSVPFFSIFHTTLLHSCISSSFVNPFTRFSIQKKSTKMPLPIIYFKGQQVEIFK